MLWEKRYVFKSFLKTVSEAASLVGSIFHRRGPVTKKALIACGMVSFGNVEPSMISLRMEVMMRTSLSVMQNNIREKGILVKIHLNTGKYRLVISNSHVDGQVRRHVHSTHQFFGEVTNSNHQSIADLNKIFGDLKPEKMYSLPRRHTVFWWFEGPTTDQLTNRLKMFQFSPSSKSNTVKSFYWPIFTANLAISMRDENRSI